jgi:hypothetical protein
MEAVSEEMPTPKPPRDWAMLTEMLRGQWQGTDINDHPYHCGMFDAYSCVARIVSEAPVGEREDALYAFLQTVMPRNRVEENGGDNG